MNGRGEGAGVRGFSVAVFFAAAMAVAVIPANAGIQPLDPGVRRGDEGAAATFEAARKAYDAGNFAQAADGYRQILSAKPANAAAWYDLGNAHFKAGELGLAIAAYQEAFDLAPRDGDLRYNFSFALAKTGESLSPSGVPPLVYLLFQLLSRTELAGLAWIFAWTALLLGAAFLLMPPRSAGLRTPVLAALVVSIFLGLWFLARAQTDPEPLGVVKTQSAELRGGPGENFNVTVTVPEGRRVVILSDSGEWLEVGTLKEGARGWTQKSSVAHVGTVD